MSGMSVRDVTTRDAVDHLHIFLPQYDEERELDWSVVHDRDRGWLLQVKDDGGDVRLWKIRLGKLEEEL